MSAKSENGLISAQLSPNALKTLSEALRSVSSEWVQQAFSQLTWTLPDGVQQAFSQLALVSIKDLLEQIKQAFWQRAVSSVFTERLKDSIERLTFQLSRELALPFSSDTFLGDFGRVYFYGNPEALSRLLRKYFTRTAVMHPERWRLLQDKYWAYCEEVGKSSAWEELAGPALLIAIKELPDDMYISDIYRHLRGEVRKGVERTLLDGRTLDSHYPVDTIRTRELEQRVNAERIEDVERWVDFQMALRRLEPLDQMIILLALKGYSHGEIATMAGMTNEAVRKRFERAKREISVFR